MSKILCIDSLVDMGKKRKNHFDRGNVICIDDGSERLVFGFLFINEFILPNVPLSNNTLLPDPFVPDKIFGFIYC